jgi:RNA recognition motif-containing protein
LFETEDITGKDDIMNMYVGNLATLVTEDELEKLFAQYGEVASTKIITDRYSKQSKGFGFVEMPNNSEADKAIKALNGTELQGKYLKISQAENRKKSHGRRRRY